MSVIKWHHRARPQEIHTSKPLDTKVAEAWVEMMNKEYPMIRHWCEPV